MNTSELLQSFCCKEKNGLRPALRLPAFQELSGVMYHAATDAFRCILIPVKEGETPVCNAGFPDLTPIFDFNKPEKQVIITRAEIEKVIEMAPKTDELDLSGQKECAECNGEGVIVCEACGHEDDCFIMLFEAKIKAMFIQSVIDVMDYCGVDSIELRPAMYNKPQLFVCGDIFFVIIGNMSEEKPFYEFK